MVATKVRNGQNMMFSGNLGLPWNNVASFRHFGHFMLAFWAPPHSIALKFRGGVKIHLLYSGSGHQETL